MSFITKMRHPTQKYLFINKYVFVVSVYLIRNYRISSFLVSRGTTEKRDFLLV